MESVFGLSNPVQVHACPVCTVFSPFYREVDACECEDKPTKFRHSYEYSYAQ